MTVFVHAQETLDISFSMNDFKTITHDDVTAIVTSKKARRVCGDSLSPDLPYFFYRVPLRSGQEEVSVNVSFSDSLLLDNIQLLSNPVPSVRNGKNQSVGSPKIAMRSVSSPLHYAGVKRQNGRAYLLLKVTPFLYDAITGRLSFINSVHFSFDGIPLGQNVNPVSIHEALNSTSNAHDVSNVPSDRTDSDTIDYLIITNSSLASSFNQLAQWKRKKCLRTKIVTLDSIYVHYPQYNDNQAKIKAYILDYASSTRKKWVLLGGDDSVVPAKYCDTPSISEWHTSPSDWYYSCYDNHPNLSWDYNNDGVAGSVFEDINLSPCVYLSRLPVRTVQHVHDYTEKLIKYENGVNVNNNMLLTGYILSENNYINGKSDSQILNEEIYDEFVADDWNGSLEKLFDTFSSIPNVDSINGNNLKSVIDMQFNVIHEISHGFETKWVVSNDSLKYYSLEHANSQANAYGSVIVTGACLTNSFDDEPCLSECLLRNPNGGAVAYFGCSRLAKGGEDMPTGNYLPIVWSDQYNAHFLHYLYTGTPYDSLFSFAAIGTESKTTVYNEFADETDDIYHELLLATNLMGDPEMPIWTDSIKSFTSGSGPSTGPYIIHSMVGGRLDVISPVGGCTIVVLDEHGNRQEANNTSYASFSGLSGQTYVAIMKHNYIPYLRTTNVSSGGILPNLLSLQASTSAGQMLTIRLEEQDNSYLGTDYVTDEWQMMIADVARGETKHVQVVEGDNCQINTSGWPSGIYAIHAYKNGNTASTKIFIQ